MIPVLICPVVSRFDLLEQSLSAIDYEVGRLVIVDNSLSGYELPRQPTQVGAVHYIRPLVGLGYPGGINAGISQTPDAPWWMWTSNDLRFGPGDLANIAALMANVKTPRMVTGSDRRLRNVYGAMNRACVETVGLFDEWTFYPIYFDDDDYEYRCRMGGVNWIPYDGTMLHEGSVTIREEGAARANSVTFQQNRTRYIAKWGGPPGSEQFPRPWNLPVPLSFTRVDIGGRAARIWR